MNVFRTLLLASAAMVVAAPAFAQKSADTLRIGINNTLSSLSQYHSSQDEASTFYKRIYQSLIAYNEYEKKFVPLLATSWTRVSPTVLEFELRQDTQFHNGNKFDADDVVATWNYLLDPNVPLRFKNRYNWVKSVEKLGPYKVRLTAKAPNAIDMGLITYRFTVQDAETMAGLQDQADYGRLTPYGTGQYKVTQLDKNKGLIVERYENFKGDPKVSRAPIKRIHGVFQPDRQTQIAQLLTGGLDLIGNVNPDQANELAMNPQIEVTKTLSGDVIYFALDASGQSGNKALTDPRVRRAIFMAINREAIVKNIVPGGETVKTLDVPCFESTIGCAYTKKAPAYDPEGAKKLLAEAGYPNGIDLAFDIYAPIKDIAIAMSGDLMKAGIRTAVQPVTMEIYRKKQGDMRLQAWGQFFPLGSHPDAASIFTLLIEGKRGEYFNNDPIVLKAVRDALVETDIAKREAIYQVAFDRMTDMSYVLPISALPGVYVHTKDVKVLNSQLSTSNQYIEDFAFK